MLMLGLKRLIFSNHSRELLESINYFEDLFFYKFWTIEVCMDQLKLTLDLLMEYQLHSCTRLHSSHEQFMEIGSFSFQANRMLSIQRRGAEFALVKLASHCRSSLPSKLPKLWEAIVGPLQQIGNGNSFGRLFMYNF